MYPQMPEAVFDVYAWFKVAFPKPQFNWYDYNETFYSDLNLWKSNEEKYQNNYEIIDIGHGKRSIRFQTPCPVQENGKWLYEDFISRGDWDHPNFSENERILAWRIECNNK